MPAAQRVPSESFLALFLRIRILICATHREWTTTTKNFLFIFCNSANSTKGFIDVGYFHDVLLSGLKNSQLYQYRVGVGHALKSAWVPFVSSPRVGSAETVSFLAYGDQGVFSPFEHLEFWQKLGVEQQQAAAQTVAIMQRFVAEGVPGVNASQSAELDHQTHRRLASRWGARRGAVQPSPRMVHPPPILPASPPDFFFLIDSSHWRYFIRSWAWCVVGIFHVQCGQCGCVGALHGRHWQSWFEKAAFLPLLSATRV